VLEAENRGANKEELEQLLGRARAKTGMFEGNLIDGELEIGQVSAQINAIQPAADIVLELIQTFEQTLLQLSASYLVK
jgi:enoyl-[acyl-carrier protein] reductase II